MKTVKDCCYIVMAAAVRNRVYSKWWKGEHSVAIDMCHIAKDMLLRGEY